MISLDTFKSSLNENNNLLSDKDTEILMVAYYKIANALFDRWQNKKKTKVIKETIVAYKENGNCIAMFYYGIFYRSTK